MMIPNPNDKQRSESTALTPKKDTTAMESYSQESYPNPGDSSPLSRDMDCDNSPSPTASYKVKFMCSYGGKIQPRTHDNQLSYVGGDTKILAVDRNSKFPAFLAKLSSLCDSAPPVFCFKFQLPGDDLDALISVTNDEDLEHMMIEYDRLTRSSLKPARLRIFLFPLNEKPNSQAYEFKEARPEGNWFIDALNPVQFRPLDVSSRPDPVISEPVNPDFLFGFDKAMNSKVSNHNPNAANLSDLNDKIDVGEPVVTIERHMERHQISEEMEKSCEDAKPNGNAAKDYETEYYKVQEKVTPVTMPMAYYWPERQIASGNYPVSGGSPMDQQPIYVIQNLPGIYHQNPSLRPATGVPPCQGYYSVSRAIPEVYCDQPLYNAVPSSMLQQPKVTTMEEGIGVVRQPTLPPGMMTEQGYKVCYDSAGRPLYYAVSVGGLAPIPPQQASATVAVVDGRGVGSDAEVVVGEVPQTSSV